MDRSLVRFYAGIRTEQTRKDYERYLGYFLKFVKIREAVGLLQLKDNYLQELVEDYVISLKSRGLSKSYIDGQIAGLELFFSMNDKVLNFKKIRKMTPARKKPKGEKPYNTEEIERMLELTTSLRNKAV
ncbi:MAG: site-specific integrase, partial [Nitrososphaera sp.]